MKKRYQKIQQRGFALIIAVIFTAVILSVATALLGISYQQLILASTARQSVYAYYNTDAALECALLWDGNDLFDYTTEPNTTGTFTCQGQSVTYTPSVAVNNTRTTTFSLPCASGGSDANVTIYKSSTGGTAIYATGYNTCNTSDPNRIQRGEKAVYGTPPNGGGGPHGGGNRVFDISPAVNGKSTWDLDSDGALVLSTAGTWTLTPHNSFDYNASMWGAGGAGGNPSRTQTANGGGGGYVTGGVHAAPTQTVTITVGSGGSGFGTGGSPGGGAGMQFGNGNGGGGGGGESFLSINGVQELVGGGGGGGGYDYAGAAAGGATGNRVVGDGGGGFGGTQSAGGAGGGTAPAGGKDTGGASNYYGGGGGSGYYGGGGSGQTAGYGNGGGGGSSYFGGALVTGGSTSGGNAQNAGGTGDSHYANNAGKGGNGSGAPRGTAGNPGEVVLY